LLGKLAAKRLLKIKRIEANNPEKLFAPYRFDPAEYIRRFFKTEAWSGTDERPGQQQVIDAYTIALRQQYERSEFERDIISVGQLKYWQPGQIIRNWIRVEAGHTVGKTWLAAKLVSHFFDCFRPSIVYAFAPTYAQINDLLFKEIRTDRDGNSELLGVVHKVPEISYKGNHFVKGRATSDAGGKGTERIQGQHGRYIMLVLDEAEGIDGYVYNAVRSMASGGIVIVLMLANPRTRSSNFYKLRNLPEVINFRVSCIYHPNVLQDKEIIPGAVRREYVTNMLTETEIVEEHNPDDNTFELPWETGIIRKPSSEFMFRVLGIPPVNLADDTFCPLGRFEAAINRAPFFVTNPKKARLGIDASRYGRDRGTQYTNHNGAVWRSAEHAQQDGFVYYEKAKAECLRLIGEGVTDIQVRVDAGGGYGSTCIDNLRRDADLLAWVDGSTETEQRKFVVYEVHNNGVPNDQMLYADFVTEMYALAGEAIKELSIIDPPSNLEQDICERKYQTVLKGARDVKKLLPKEKFRNLFGRSPDDGDGFVLSVAPDFIFAQGVSILWA
jgi:hypothetical protein